MYTSSWRRCGFLATAVAIALSACDGDATAPERLTVAASVTELFEHQSAELTAMVDGRRLAASQVSWSSRDPSTIRVSGATAVARAPGTTWLVAQAGPLSDSVEVVVRFPSLPLNSVAARISAAAEATEHRFSLTGNTLQFEHAAGAHSIVQAAVGGVPGLLGSDVLARDTIVRLRLPHAVALGEHTLPPLKLEFSGSFIVQGDAGVIIAIRETPDASSTALYVAVREAPLEITSVTLPSDRGRVAGEVRGRMAFEAAAVRVRAGSPDQPPTVEPIGDRTFAVYLEFATALYRVPLSAGTLSLSSSAFSGSQPGGGRAKLNDDGAVSVVLQTLLGGKPDPDAAEPPTFVELRLEIPGPEAGTFPLGQPQQPRLVGFLAPFHRDGGSGSGSLGERMALHAPSGTVTILDYRAPTGDAYGEIVARVSGTLVVEGATPDEAITVDWSFRAPIAPLAGEPVQ